MWRVSKITVKIINKAIRKRKESRNRNRAHERGGRPETGMEFTKAERKETESAK